MSVFRSPKYALFGLLLSGAAFLSQAQTSSTTQLTMSSGIVGASSTESVRLNVLNLQPVISGVTPAACPATLEIYDDAGNLLKQMAVANIPPSTAANLVFKPTVSSTAVNARAQIRAVVLSPTPVITPVANPGSPVVIVPLPSCTLMSSLEITNDSTGDTQIMTTDFRAAPTYLVAQPLPAEK